MAVLGSEHYFDAVQHMHCAAAPIFNVAGQLTGVLDISSEALPFGFDAMALVEMYAGLLENRLLAAQSAVLLVLRLQIHPALFGTPVAALVAVDANGKIVWANRSAARLLRVPVDPARNEPLDAETAFDLRLGQIVSLSRDSARPVVLPNGLSVWIRAESAPWEGSMSAPVPTVAPAPNRARPMAAPEIAAAPPLVSPAPREAQEDVALRARDRDFIASVLEQCDGNVTRAATRLHVSRGLIYRRLKA